MTPYITESLASFNFATSPSAVINSNPARINIITETPINIGQIKFNTALISSSKLKPVPAGVGGKIIASTAIGEARRKNETNVIIFFVIDFIFINYQSQLHHIRDPHK